MYNNMYNMLMTSEVWNTRIREILLYELASKWEVSDLQNFIFQIGLSCQI